MTENKDNLDIFVLEQAFPEAHRLFSFKIPSLESVKASCDVVLDTNVLLLPYGTGSKSLVKIREVYAKLKDQGRLFLPARVAREFARHRVNKLSEVSKRLADSSSKIVLPEAHSYPLLEELPDYSRLAELKKEIDQKVKEYRKTVSTLQQSIRGWAWNDPVAEMYGAIFTAEIIRELSQSQEELQKDLDYKNANKVPPGYRDAAKEDRGIGDRAIWLAILGIGRDRKAPLIFVTGEEKSDWVYRLDDKGLLPRYELVDEFRRASSGNPFYITSFSDFLELFDAPAEVVSAVQQEEKTFKLDANSTTSVQLNFGVSKHPLMELAATEPRLAIQQAWEGLAEEMLLSDNVEIGPTRPDSVAISHAFRKLGLSVKYPSRLVNELKDLHAIATKAFNQSMYAFSPSSSDAEWFVSRCLSLGTELGLIRGDYSP
jgi:predicted nucleic acid-binding protein